MTTCGSCGALVPEGARFCSACGAAWDAPAATVREERKLATILFADLVGSTALAHDEDPERVRALLERYYEAIAGEIERTGGTVEKFAGDGVMAAFGAPAAHEDHAERALHAGLAMQRRLDELFEGKLALRVGVNTGEVVVGQAREGGTFVTGDAVNVAARLEQGAASGEVLAGERTVAAARGAFEFGDARVIDAKGKPGGVVGQPVVRGLTLTRPRGFAGFRHMFVGREREVDLLLATVRRAFGQREPHLVTIVGEPGVGKTTLVRELWERLSAEDGTPVRRTGRCLPYGDGITYWPLGEVLKEHFGLLEGDAAGAVLRHLEGREILGLALGLEVAAGLHPLDAREQLHEAAVGFLGALASERPAVVLFEDVHWAEDDFLDLLERIVREVRAPIAVLATTRPELFDRRPTWGGGRRNAATIWLEPLEEVEASRLVDGLLEVELPTDLRQLLVERSEGNPFFVEELVGELVDAGVIERDGDGWAMRDVPEGFAVPDSVQAVIAARLDRLPPLEKSALQAAAVVGRAFWPSSVIHLVGDEPDFDLLEERDFVRRRAGSSLAGQREYAIKHALTREVAYASIPKARRGKLHAALGDWLIALDLAEEHVALVAYHYAEAVRPDDADLVWGDDPVEHARRRREAVSWLRRAGGLARGRYETEEAIDLFTRALEHCDDPRERSLCWREIGMANALRYDGEGMRVALLASLDGPLDDAERADTYATLAFQASLRSAMWSIRMNRRFIEEWADRAADLAEEGSDAQVRAILARANVEPSEVADSVLAETSALAEALGSVELRSYAFGSRAVAAYERRRFDEAATWAERRLELLPSIDDPDHLCEAYESAVPPIATVGRAGEARRLAELHWNLARRLSAHHRVHSVSLLLELGDARGDWEAMAADSDAVWDAVRENLETPCVRNPRDLLLCALAHVCLGDATRAAELERDAERIAGQGYDSYLSGPRLRLALERGDRDAAAALAELRVERAFVWGSGSLSHRLDALVALGRTETIESEAPQLAQAGTLVEPFALRALGFARREDDLIASAHERFAALGLDWHAAQTERLFAGL